MGLRFFFGAFISLPFLFLSCSDDCQQVEIEKTEWITHYEKYSVDTLANYSIVRDYIYFDESYSSKINELYKDIKLVENASSDIKSHLRTISQNKLSGRNYIAREIQIKNESDFPASLAIKDDAFFYKEGTNNYQVIGAHSTATFHLSGSIYWDRQTSSDFRSEIGILRKKHRISLTRRIDSLVISKVRVNSCEQNIPTLKREYNTIKELYYSKVDANGKPVVQIIKSDTANYNDQPLEVVTSNPPKMNAKDAEEKKCMIGGTVALAKLEHIYKNMRTSHIIDKDKNYAEAICNAVLGNSLNKDVVNADKATKEEKALAKRILDIITRLE